jgi:hypothetical protein
MKFYFFVWCLLITFFSLHGSRIIKSIDEDKKREYRTNIFRLLYDRADHPCKEIIPLSHLLYKEYKPNYHIPKKYKKILKKYSFYSNGTYIIDRPIIKQAIIDYMSKDVSNSDDDAEEMPLD